MGDNTGIGWTDATWNFFVGCSIKSPGCINCYAQKQAFRITKMNPDSHYVGTVKLVKGSPLWSGVLNLAPDKIRFQPLHWSRPRRIFTNSMSDAFHEDAPLEWMVEMFAIMAMSPQHQFQVLTKRPEIMRDVLSRSDFRGMIVRKMTELHEPSPAISWPLPNVWLGVSAERQKEWDERKHELRKTPAAVRFVSFEPLIGPIEEPNLASYVNWAIIGGESGPNARPLNYSWVERIILDGMASDVSIFVKQMGARPLDDLSEERPATNANLNHPKGENMAEWPPHFRVQEYPVALEKGALL